MVLATLDEEERSRLAASTTLNVLRRQDPLVERILCSASHVIVYELQSELKSAEPKWRHTDVQGAMHVIQRQQEPWFRLLVMNRKGIDNLLDDIVPGKVELERSTNLIMYKNQQGKVRGVWFYDEAEVDKAFSVLDGILSEKITATKIGEPGSQDPTMANFPTQVVEGGNFVNSTGGNEIELLFPGLKSGTCDQKENDNPKVPTQLVTSNGRSEDFVNMQHTGVQNVAYSVMPLQQAESGVESLHEDGNLLLRMLRGGPSTGPDLPMSHHVSESFADSAIVAQSAPGDGPLWSKHMLQEDATNAQRQVPSPIQSLGITPGIVAASATTGSVGMEDEEGVLSILNRAAEMTLGTDAITVRRGRLSKDEFRGVIHRLIEDSQYFDRVYQKYASQS